MLGRRILLALGSLALIGGIALSVLWLRTPGTAVDSGPKIERQSVLAVTRSLKARSLLHASDLNWKSIPATDVPAGSYLQGQALPADFAGAVARHDLLPGQILTADQIVKANEAGFLPAVLAPSMRAISISVGPAEGASGLIVPGDRVDVILTQNFAELGVNPSRRSVSETVLSDLRVVAIDQTTVADRRPPAADARPNIAAQPNVAKTATLEVTARQAETLMVALQLGKVQLTLRTLDDDSPGPPRSRPESQPTWGSDVSPALRSIDDASLPATGAPATSWPAPAGTVPESRATVEILHGSRTEIRCFNEAGQTATDCGGGAAPAVPISPAVTPPATGAPAPPPNRTP